MHIHNCNIEKYGTVTLFTNLLILYFHVWITFSFIYFLLDIMNLGPITNSLCVTTNQQNIIFTKMSSSLNLSGTTLFSGEKGEIIPYGLSKPTAFIEGTLGFLIPPFIMAMSFPSRISHFGRNGFSIISLVKCIFFVSIGSLFAALGLKSFLVPNHIIDGGIVGISIIFSYLTGLKLELYLLLLNLPFLYIGYKKIGKRFVVTTLIGISILSLGTYFLYNTPIPTNNLFAASILGGLLLGIGVGLVIRYGGSLDGTELVGILVNRATTYSIGRVIMFINIFIFFSAGFVFGWDKALYSVLTYVIASKMIDVTIEGFHI